MSYRRSRLPSGLVTALGIAASVVVALFAVYLTSDSSALPSFGGSNGGGAPPAAGPPYAPPTDVAGAFAQGDTALIRTDFSDDAAWKRVIKLVRTTPDEAGNRAQVAPLSDRHYEGMDPKALGDEAMAADLMQGYAILADARSMAEAAAGGEVTVVYVDLSPEAAEDAQLFETFPGNSFRTVTAQVASIEVNLSIGNVDFSEFATSVDQDGVYRSP